MVSEALLISPKRVHVRYRFRNESPAPIDAEVAFPIPAFGWNPGESAWDANVGPMDSFAVSVEGRIFSSLHDLTTPERQLPGGPDLENPMDSACLSEGRRSAVLRRMTALFRQGAKTVRVTLEDVEYILGTGRNWKGPISDFTLDVMKQSPDQVVSLCFPGKATRIDGQTLRFQRKDFVPPDSLLVYFYTLTPEE